MQSKDEIDKSYYYIWLSHVCGEGSALSSKLLQRFETAENIYHLTKDDFENLEDINMNNGQIRRLCDKDLNFTDKIAGFCMKDNIGIIDFNDGRFPLRLKNIRMPPVILYYKGNYRNLDNELCITVVGTRKMTDYGKYTAYNLSRDLAESGACIISGMADGIDSAAHKGCLYAKGYTAAVLGCGVERVYPVENEKLMQTIIERGIVISEFPPFSEPKGMHFPIRNRIMSGLSQATVVVEADAKSGSLITARAALFQGRELYAVPGNIGNSNSAGTNELIKNGAGIVTSAFDILSEYEYLYSDKIKIKENIKRAMKNKTEVMKKFRENIRQTQTEMKPEREKSKENLTPEQKLKAMEIILEDMEADIFKKICESKSEFIVADTLVGEKHSASDVMHALSILEIYGVITSTPGGTYRLSDMYNKL